MAMVLPSPILVANGTSRPWHGLERCGQRIVVDVAFDVLMPCQIANVLDDPDHRRLQFMLNTEAELRNRGSLVRLWQVLSSRPAKNGVGGMSVPVTQLVLGIEK